MLPSTEPRTLIDLALTSPRTDACSPIVSVPVESILPSTSPSNKSSSENLMVPLIETPRERRPPGWDDPDPLEDDSARAGSVDRTGVLGSDFRVENIAIK